MKKKNQRKNNLQYSLLLLLLLLVFLIVSTYAWFTSNQTVTISTLDVNVKTSNGLQISADAVNWKTILQKEDITGATATYSTNTNQLPAEMEPVSSAGTVSNGLMDMFFGDVNANDTGDGYTLVTTKETDTRGETGRYIAFDIFLRVDTATKVYLTTDSNVIPKGTDKGLQNAARVAFIDEGNASIETAPSAIQALKNGTTSIIWEPNYDVHTPAGVLNAQEVYGVTTQTTGAAQIAYDGVKAEFNLEQGVLLTTADEDTFPAYFGAVTPGISTVQNFSTQQELLDLKAGVTKVRIYMWIEGQDVDCENNASGTDISFNVQITKATE